MRRWKERGGEPPAPSSALSKQGYSTLSSITENALSATWAIPKKRSKTEEEYFDEEDEGARLEYIPAPGSPTGAASHQASNQSDDEEDPLDAYMAAIQHQVKKECEKTGGTKAGGGEKGVRQDIDTEDVEESYYRYMEENPRAGLQEADSDPEIDYDLDGNPIIVPKKKVIEPLPPMDHSLIEYGEFAKNFYTEHEDIERLESEGVAKLRSALGLRVSGPNPPKPVSSFAHFGFDEALMKSIRKSEYSQPTAIQSQAIPAALSGRDIIGIAKTGSGKTAAFIWPMLVHVMDQPELKPSDGPIALILAPTRELSQQIYAEAKRFGKVYKVRVVCCYGGGSKWEQSKALEEGAEVVVATPGRVIDLVKMKALSLTRVTYLVLDEADRMFDMGFEGQVRSICNQVRPDRQSLLFSATFKKRIERLARDVLTDPVRIVQGELGEANQDVSQVVLVLLQSNKLPWLIAHLVEFTSQGSLLVFVTKKVNAEEVAGQLRNKEVEVLLLHGDMDQVERNRVITAFKKRETDILIATDVAARGLDIAHIRTVVNFDVARDIETHTHRVGRTGRAGVGGTAFTLVTSADREFAGHLVRNLEGADQPVPQPLLDLALQSGWFRKSRFKTGKGKSAAVGGAGLGFREKPSPSVHHHHQLANTSPPTHLATPPHLAVGGSLCELMSKSRGPAMDRLQAMKAAFKAQYQNQFTAAEDDTWEQTLENPEGSRSKKGPLQEKKLKKSRWDNS